MILAVDDEQLELEGIRRVLERGGFTVCVAEDYRTGVAIFQQHAEEIELAVIDVSIPGRNGIELAKDFLRLRPALKLLFTSGHVGAEVIRFYGLPASDRHFLKKPFKGAQLLSRVREILQSQEPFDWLSRVGPPGDTDGETNDQI